MMIGKLDIKAWEYGGVKLRPPLRILLSLAVYPIYVAGKVLVSVSAMVSDLSVESGVDAWRDID